MVKLDGLVKIEAPRGTHDILPSAQPRWKKVKDEAERLCALYGYRRIDTPSIEHTELFLRTTGEGSDIVQKEMYTFEDRGGRSLTLRPEGTPPICRAYIQHGLSQQPQPQKLYTIGPMWRYDRPQRGRYREHWQLSVEAIGSDDAALDAEIIQLYDTLLRNLGAREYILQLNSIGDRNCRPAYLERLEAWLDKHEDALDDEARRKRSTNALRVFDVKNPAVLTALADAPKIGESLCDECQRHFSDVRRLLDALGVTYELVPTLVRGLDYYTRTTWEFVGPEEGAQSSISGGGRYDYLVEEIGGPPTPGVGFGAGIERLLQATRPRTRSTRLPVFIAREPDTRDEDVVRVLAELRRRRVRCDTDYVGRSARGQEKQMSRLKPRLTLYLGASVTIRELGQPDEQVSYEEAVDRIRERLR